MENKKHKHTTLCEKGKIEKNHTLFRDIVPKEKSFDNFTQGTVNLMFSHVNAIKRKIFNDKSPYELFAFSYFEKLASALRIFYIAPTDIVQSSKLLRVSFSLSAMSWYCLSISDSESVRFAGLVEGRQISSGRSGKYFRYSA